MGMMSCQNCHCGQKEREEQQALIESARKVDKIEIRQRDKDKLMDGRNTIVVMNGQPLKYVKSIEVKVDAKGLGIVKLEMYASVAMDESVVKDAEVGVSE
jgi:hypothetical protein